MADPSPQDFQHQHPEVTVNLTNRTRPFLFADTEFDAAIYFGDADWSGTESHRLMGENPCRCAALACWAAARIQPSKSQNCRCLQQTRPYAWRQWFNAQQLNIPRDMTGPRYELFSMLSQAAMHDMGSR
jgi:DNA-binding transcriptional LysR family regulator